MKEELDKLLVEKYPKIFRDRYENMQVTAMCWGFDHGDGWFWLIDKLCERIQSHIDLNSKQNRIKNKCLRKIMDIIKIPCFKSKYLTKIYFKFYYSIEKEEYESIEQVVAIQVKEKFGGLRFYYNGGDDRIDGMVSFAEHLSYYICENCGSTDNVTQDEWPNWIFTLCDKCRALKNSGKELDNLL